MLAGWQQQAAVGGENLRRELGWPEYQEPGKQGQSIRVCICVVKKKKKLAIPPSEGSGSQSDSGCKVVQSHHRPRRTNGRAAVEFHSSGCAIHPTVQSESTPAGMACHPCSTSTWAHVESCPLICRLVKARRMRIEKAGVRMATR